MSAYSDSANSPRRLAASARQAGRLARRGLVRAGRPEAELRQSKRFDRRRGVAPCFLRGGQTKSCGIGLGTTAATGEDPPVERRGPAGRAGIEMRVGNPQHQVAVAGGVTGEQLVEIRRRPRPAHRGRRGSLRSRAGRTSAGRRRGRSPIATRLPRRCDAPPASGASRAGPSLPAELPLRRARARALRGPPRGRRPASVRPRPASPGRVTESWSSGRFPVRAGASVRRRRGAGAEGTRRRGRARRGNGVGAQPSSDCLTAYTIGAPWSRRVQTAGNAVHLTLIR